MSTWNYSRRHLCSLNQIRLWTSFLFPLENSLRLPLWSPKPSNFETFTLNEMKMKNKNNLVTQLARYVSSLKKLITIYRKNPIAVKNPSWSLDCARFTELSGPWCGVCEVSLWARSLPLYVGWEVGSKFSKWGKQYSSDTLQTGKDKTVTYACEKGPFVPKSRFFAALQ